MNKDVSKKIKQLTEVLRRFISCKEASQGLPPEVRKALTNLLEITGCPEIADLISQALCGGASNQKPDSEQRLVEKLLEKLQPSLSRIEEKLECVYGRIEESRGVIFREKTQNVNITFTNTSVIVDGKPERKRAPLLLAEYIILKRKPVLCLWAYVILPEFEAKDPDWQFRNYISKVKRKLADHGIHVITKKEKYNDGIAMFQGMDDCVVSNIKDIWKLYEQAVSQYEEGNISEAINALSPMTKDIENQWHNFTDAYIDLARWICELNFEGVQKSVIDSCAEFLGWYKKRLRLGTLKIEDFMRKEALGTQALDVLKDIRKESERAEKLYSLLVQRQPLTQDEQDYENTVGLMMNFREKLLSINEDSGGKVEEVTIGEAVKLLCEKNSVLAEVVEYGHDTLDELLEAKHQRHKCTVEEIQDMRELIYQLVGDLIVETENYDEFEQSKINKLMSLKHYLRSRLRQKLKTYV